MTNQDEVLENPKRGIKVSIKEQAKKALWKAYGKGATHSGYVSDLKDNLVAGVRIKDFEKDLTGGAGQELISKILAIHSSSALVVNCFSRFKAMPEAFQLGNLKRADTLAFEHQLSTGLGGTRPHLDVWVETPSGTLAIESKFLEYLTPKTPKFSASYEKLEAVTGDKQLWKLYRKTLNGKPAFLDCAQLIKHCFGILAQKRKGVEATLVYLYWEPRNAEDFEEFRNHRAEITDFSKGLAGSSIPFVAMTYSELWEQWSTKPELKNHVAALRKRYEVSI